MRAQKGFSLVEILIALLILGFCLVGVFNLLPLGLQSLAYSHRLNETAIFAEKKIEDFKSMRPRTVSSTSGVDGPLSWTINASVITLPPGIQVIAVDLGVTFDYQRSAHYERFITYVTPDDL